MRSAATAPVDAAQEGAQGVERVGQGEGALGGGDEGVESVLEDRVDQLVLVGEPPVRRAHADAGMAGDLVERRRSRPPAAKSSRAASRMRRRLRSASRAQRALGVGSRLVGHAAHLSDKWRQALQFRATVCRRQAENRPPLPTSGDRMTTTATTTRPRPPPRAPLADPRASSAIAQLMVVLDATIVNIALPSAQQALGFSDDNRQWVVTAYALAFGSLLLLGGRLGDLFGRKRTSSSACSASPPPPPSAAPPRASACWSPPAPPQGAFGALLAPAALVAADHDLHRPGRARQGVRHLRRHRRRRRAPSACSSAAC